MSVRHPVTQLVANDARRFLVLLRGRHFDVVSTATGKVLATTAPAAEVARPADCLRIAEGHAERITAATFSRDGGLLATTADDKSIRVWDTQHWTCNWQHRSGKRPTALSFTPDAKQLVIADKFGDVFALALDAPAPAPAADEDSKSVLGHLSLITDMVRWAKYRRVVANLGL